MTASRASASPARWWRSRTVAAAVVGVAVFGATAVAVWRLASDGSGSAGAPTPTVAVTTPVGVAAEIVSPGQLRAIAGVLGRPLYWAGSRTGTRIEYTQTSDGTTYVRYLTGSAKVGDKGSAYVVVVTYAQPNAFRRVQSIARAKRFRIERLGNGAVAVTQPGTPRNIHVVFPGEDYQVEVYAPTAAQARSIALSGAVSPVG